MRDEKKSMLHAESGRAYLKNGLLDEAIVEFKASLSFAPDNLGASVNLATALKQKKSFPEAITILESLVNQDREISNENLGMIHYNLGNTYRDIKNEDKAIEQYKKAVEKRPNHASTWHNLGQSYFSTGDLENAAKAYEKALEYNPNHTEARARLELFNDLKDSGEIEAVKEIITKPSDEFEKMSILGVEYSLQGKFDIAISEFKKALNLYPDEGALYIRLAEAQFDFMHSKELKDLSLVEENIKLLDRAEQLIISGKSKYPRDKYNGLSELHDLKGRCFIVLKNYQLATEELEKALEIEPNREESIKMLSKLEDFKGFMREKESKSKSKGCFIATACYGTSIGEEVKNLCSFRDKYLDRNLIGRAMVQFYYNHAPKAADFIMDKEYLKIIIRECLRPYIWIINKIGR